MRPRTTMPTAASARRQQGPRPQQHELRCRLLQLLLLQLAMLLSLLGVSRAGAPPGPETAFNDAGYISVDQERRHVSTDVALLDSCLPLSVGCFFLVLPI